MLEHYHQILNGVILGVAVEMVNVFLGQQRATNMFLHYCAMFERAPAPVVDPHVREDALRVRVILAH